MLGKVRWDIPVLEGTGFSLGFSLQLCPVPGALDFLWFGWSKQDSSSVVGALSREAFKAAVTLYTKYVATFIRRFSDLLLARNPTHFIALVALICSKKKPEGTKAVPILDKPV